MSCHGTSPLRSTPLEGADHGWFEYKGGRIHYEEEGSGDPILMLPGWAGSIDELSSLRKVLAPSYRVIAAVTLARGRAGRLVGVGRVLAYAACL